MLSITNLLLTIYFAIDKKEIIKLNQSIFTYTIATITEMYSKVDSVLPTVSIENISKQAGKL